MDLHDLLKKSSELASSMLWKCFKMRHVMGFDRRQHQPRTIYWWIWYTKREILPGHLPFEILSTLLHLGPNFRITPWRISEGQSTVLRMLSVSQLGLCSDHDLYFSKGRSQQGINNGLQFREDPNENPITTRISNFTLSLDALLTERGLLYHQFTTKKSGNH